MRKRRFNLAELFIWVALCGVLLAWLAPTFRELAGRRDFFGVEAIAISADGSTAAAASYNGRVRVWDLSRRTPLRPIQTKASGIERIALSSGGSLLAIALPSATGAVRGDAIEIWDLRSGERIDSFPVGWRAPFCFSPRRPLLAAIVDDRAEVRSYEDGSDPVPIQIESDIQRPAALAFSVDGRSLAIGGGDSIEFFRSGDLAREASIDVPIGWRRDLSISPEGRQLLSAHASMDDDRRWFASLNAYNASTGDLEGTLDQEVTYSGVSAAYLPDGRILFAASDQLHVLDPRTRAILGEPLDSDERIRCIAAPSTGTVFLAGGRESIALWDAKSLSPIATLWNSSTSVNSSKQKIWRALILLPMVCLCIHFLQQARRRNHLCPICSVRFTPQTAEDWSLGCPSCHAAGRIDAQKIAQFERIHRIVRYSPAFSTAMYMILFAGVGLVCWLKSIPIQLYSPLGATLILMAVMPVCAWFSFFLQPKYARRAAPDKARAKQASPGNNL